MRYYYYLYISEICIWVSSGWQDEPHPGDEPHPHKLYYSATLARIKAQKGRKAQLVMEVLMWLSHSGQSLKASELCHTLRIEVGSTELDYQNIPTVKSLLGCRLGLVQENTLSFLSTTPFRITYSIILTCFPALTRPLRRFVLDKINRSPAQAWQPIASRHTCTTNPLYNNNIHLTDTSSYLPFFIPRNNSSYSSQ